ncbi:MAG: phospholipid/cholesterol/gamma-HCH transport system substrate-binding protein [Solirubrobacteraceae bacterium]|jgi:virulence factor Mce-like protein|nr:phospholipid/cholesterol/gamma-HCH transport system substrate-binding protein [Solirubrobacteraceae bacterium]
MSRGKDFKGHVITTIVVSVLGLSILFVSVGIGGGLPSFSHPYSVRIVLPTSASLTKRARVTMAGVEVGKVKSVERKGVAAVAEVQITDKSVTPISTDSRAALRVRTAVGENFLEIDPGTSARHIDSGGMLPIKQADDYVDVDQVLSVLQGRTRDRARDLLQGLQTGVEDRGTRLNTLLDGTSGILADGSRLFTLLDNDRAQVSRLVDGLGQVTHALGERGQAIHTIAADGLTTFRALAARDDSLRDLLHELPPTLRQVQTTTNTVRSVTQRATPVVVNLGLALRDARPAVQALQPASSELRGTLSALGTAAPRLKTTLSRVRSLSRPAPAALTAVHKTICQVNPMLRYAKPYTNDVISLITGLGSAANSYDATGHLLRLTAIVDDESLAGAPDQVNSALHTLLHSGLVGETSAVDYDPIPPPGVIGTTHAPTDGKTTLGPDQVPASGYKYPRIQADC